jgi:hypothetical protein
MDLPIVHDVTSSANTNSVPGQHDWVDLTNTREVPPEENRCGGIGFRGFCVITTVVELIGIGCFLVWRARNP